MAAQRNALWDDRLTGIWVMVDMADQIFSNRTNNRLLHPKSLLGQEGAMDCG